MEFFFELLFQFLGELLLQAALQIASEVGLRALVGSVSKPRHPIIAGVGLAVWGALAGGATVLAFPAALIADPALRLVNLIVTPIVLGLLMMWVGRIRTRRGQTLVRLDRFGFAFVFAFSMSLVRYAGTI